MSTLLSFWKWVVLLSCFPLVLTAQKSYPLNVSIYNNATMIPGGGRLWLTSYPVHLGATAGTEFYYNHREKNRWLQTARVGYHYHRYVQHAIQLYSEFGYRRRWTSGATFDARLGGGYLHTIPAAQVFELQDNGTYERKRAWGRPQFMAGLTVGGGYTILRDKPRPLRLFLEYQFYVQGPFVRSYVPILPNTAMHIGVSRAIF